jgi:hypothetical protein
MKLEKAVNVDTSFFFFFFGGERERERGPSEILKKKNAFVNSITPYVEFYYLQIQDKFILHF